MARHQKHKEQREAEAAAKEADTLRTELEQKSALEKERTAREKEKAQRMLMRSLRAGAGGYFETDTGQGTLLGGSGVIG